MGKYDSKLMKYGKASGAFEYAANRYAEDSTNQQFRQDAVAAYNFLEKVAYTPIEDAFKNNPDDGDAAEAYEIATRDLMSMRNKLHSLP